MIRFKLLIYISFFMCSAIFNVSAQTSQLIIGASANLKITDLQNLELNPSNAQWLYDLDNNGVNDLRVVCIYNIGSATTTQSVTFQTFDSCTFSGTLGKGYAVTTGKTDTTFFTAPIAKILNPGDTVFSAKCTSTTAGFSSHIIPAPGTTKSYVGEWISGVHYAGIKKVVNNKEYLGWLKLEVTSYMSAVLKEIAIQTIPSGIDHLFESSISLYPNPAISELHINGDNCLKIEVYNVLGSLLNTLENKNNSSSLLLDLEKLQGGIYFVKVIERGSNNYFTKKIIKQ